MWLPQLLWFRALFTSSLTVTQAKRITEVQGTYTCLSLSQLCLATAYRTSGSFNHAL